MNQSLEILREASAECQEGRFPTFFFPRIALPILGVLLFHL